MKKLILLLLVIFCSLSAFTQNKDSVISKTTNLQVSLLLPKLRGEVGLMDHLSVLAGLEIAYFPKSNYQEMYPNKHSKFLDRLIPFLSLEPRVYFVKPKINKQTNEKFHVGPYVSVSLEKSYAIDSDGMSFNIGYRHVDWGLVFYDFSLGAGRASNLPPDGPGIALVVDFGIGFIL